MSPHPPIVPLQLMDFLRSYSAAGELSGKLPDEQLTVIFENRWFNMFVPISYGGLQLDLPDGLRLQENLARIDGSLGWTVTLCSGANYFIGYLPKLVRDELFSNLKVCFAGSGYPSGLAIKHPSGYTVQGSWKYATGIPHATVITAVCYVRENEKLLNGSDGKPLAQAFWFNAGEARIRKDWNAMGMIATQSHGFEIDSLTVPHDRTFTIAAGHAQLPDAIYRFPFLQFAQCTLTANLSGMTMRFLELCEIIFMKRGSSVDVLSSVVLEFEEARTDFFTVTERSWMQLSESGEINATTLEQVSVAAMNLAAVCRRVINRLYPYCGLSAAMKGEEVNRVWRNFHTASQHTLFGDVKRQTSEAKRKGQKAKSKR